MEVFLQEPARATGPQNMAHHRRHSTGSTSLSLHMRNLLGQCMLSCTPKRAPHLPNTTMPTKSCTHPHLGSIAITF